MTITLQKKILRREQFLRRPQPLITVTSKKCLSEIWQDTCERQSARETTVIDALSSHQPMGVMKGLLDIGDSKTSTCEQPK